MSPQYIYDNLTTPAVPWADAVPPTASVVFDRRLWLIFGPLYKGSASSVWFFYPG